MPLLTPSPMTVKRIHRELADLKREDTGDIRLAPLSDNLFQWKATIPGPEGSVYEGGMFDMLVEVPPDYPFGAPKVLFQTRIYHMNISERGNVCIDVLKHNWSPALSLYKVVLSLSSLLTDPNPQDPLVPSIAKEYSRNRKKHDSTAREWTKLYAKTTRPVEPPKAAEILESGPSSSRTPLPSAPSLTRPANGSPTQQRSSASSSRQSEVITLESDSEAEAEALVVGASPTSGGTKKRKRPQPDAQSSSTTQAEQRRRISGPEDSIAIHSRTTEVIEIED